MADGDDINAHFTYAMSFQLIGDTPDKQAVASAKTSLSYYKSIEFVESNLTMASLLISAGQYDWANPTIDKALIWARGGAKTAARQMRKYIDR